MLVYLLLMRLIGLKSIETFSSGSPDLNGSLIFLRTGSTHLQGPTIILSALTNIFLRQDKEVWARQTDASLRMVGKIKLTRMQIRNKLCLKPFLTR